MVRSLLLGLVVISCSLLTACNTVSGTVHGAARDVQTVTGTTHHTVKHHTAVKEQSVKHHAVKSQKHTTKNHMARNHMSKKKSSTVEKSTTETQKTTDTNSSY